MSMMESRPRSYPQLKGPRCSRVEPDCLTLVDMLGATEVVEVAFVLAVVVALDVVVALEVVVALVD